MVGNACRGTKYRIFQCFTSFLTQMVYIVVRAHERLDSKNIPKYISLI